MVKMLFIFYSAEFGTSRDGDEALSLLKAQSVFSRTSEGHSGENTSKDLGLGLAVISGTLNTSLLWASNYLAICRRV